MVQAKIFVLAVLLIASVSALVIETEGEESFLQDLRNNISDLEWNTIIQTLNEVENMFYATDY